MSSTYAQEGTKQLMPDSTDIHYLEIYGPGNRFGTYRAADRERIYIRLKAGEIMFFGMKMFQQTADHRGDPARTSVRVNDPTGNIVFPAQAVPTSGPGYIASYKQAVCGPIGAIINGDAVRDGYEPLSFVAPLSGDYYLEYETWQDVQQTRLTTQGRETWFEFFDVTVTDADSNIVTNSNDPTRPAGRLWSRQWALNTTSFERFPVKTAFYIYTEDGFVNRVRFEMFPFEYTFVSNAFGIKQTNDAFANRRSVPGNALANNI
ncbi:MAG: hypothetical protein HC880_16360, partial [Bacteroidia bacterium]|nr:hypothetical protein [Bacteroidia bacterium]